MAYDQETGLATDDMVMVRIAPTGLKNFKRYAKTIAATLKRPTWSVITQLSFDPKFDYPVVVPTLVDKISDATELKAISEAQVLAKQLVMEPFDVSKYEPPGQTTAAAAKKRSKMS